VDEEAGGGGRWWWWKRRRRRGMDMRTQCARRGGEKWFKHLYLKLRINYFAILAMPNLVLEYRNKWWINNDNDNWNWIRDHEKLILNTTFLSLCNSLLDFLSNSPFFFPHTNTNTHNSHTNTHSHQISKWDKRNFFKRHQMKMMKKSS
jgi:hypothetical protein